MYPSLVLAFCLQVVQLRYQLYMKQEGILRLWRGTNASLALAVPTVGIYLPCYDVIRNYMEEFAEQNAPSLAPYSPFLAGSVARSLACISCYPIELAKTRMQAFKETQFGKKPSGVWKTLIEVVAPFKNTTNLQSLRNYRILWTGLGAQLARDVPFSGICWSTLEPVNGGMKGMFTGVGPRVARAGPSVGIVVSSYEVMKYYLHQRRYQMKDAM
uniref:Mitochondrial carrier protein n=1 Tax=Kalanchoe fedtschenkoi TaxID=63787 RepID=A0A7N0UFV4_KALFE